MARASIAGGYAMKLGWVGLALVLAVAPGCRSRRGHERVSVPIEEVFVEGERSPAKSGGWCERCNIEVFDGHRCGLTVPCALCKREQGARHLHEVVWTCGQDDVVMAAQHECNDAKTCFTCRADKRSFLGTRGCEQCYRQVPATKVHGITSYCQECNLEAGANHIHGKTVLCRSCLREAAGGHKCDATRLCMEHQAEHGPDHVCGTTEYCKRCHREAGPEHKHGQTEWCWRCQGEMEWPHSHHYD
jgi:hypothetical protein